MKPSIKAIIIDDEQLARSIISSYLSDHKDVELVAECDNGFEGLKAIQQHAPDLIFLDVMMPKITGFEMLELVDDPPIVVFSTAYDEFAIRAFEQNAVDYLLKPYSKERFETALQKVRQKISSHEKPVTDINELSEASLHGESLERVVVKVGTKINIIAVEDIVCIEAMDDYVRLHVADSSYLKQSTMKFYESNLPKTEFVRIHRSYIVQAKEISKLEPMGKESYVALLKGGRELPVSRSGYTRLKEILKF